MQQHEFILINTGVTPRTPMNLPSPLGLPVAGYAHFQWAQNDFFFYFSSKEAC